MFNPYQFKIRCSSIEAIAAEAKGGRLIPVGAANYAERWAKEQLYQRRKKGGSSNATKKGNDMEGEAIELVGEVLGLGWVEKNETLFEDEHFKGTPDVIQPDFVLDTKCSWDCFAFPLFEPTLPKMYWWQVQGYMHLTGRRRACVSYCLMDAPETIIMSEARKRAWAIDEPEIPIELYDEVKADMTYSHLPVELRVKNYWVDFDPEAIAFIKNRVEKIREYLESLK